MRKLATTEFNEIVDYLAANFLKTPKINVNKAAAKVSRAAWTFRPRKRKPWCVRAKMGSFKSIEELDKVPGVDVKKIEAKKTDFRSDTIDSSTKDCGPRP